MPMFVPKAQKLGADQSHLRASAGSCIQIAAHLSKIAWGHDRGTSRGIPLRPGSAQRGAGRPTRHVVALDNIVVLQAIWESRRRIPVVVADIQVPTPPTG